MMTALLYHQLVTNLADGHGIERASIEVESEAISVRNARSFVRHQLVDWGVGASGDFVDAVVLAVSELVTNAVVHGRTRPLGESELVGVTLAFKPGIALGVLVTDNCDELELVATPASMHATDGRGLGLVSSVADYWTAAAQKPREDGLDGTGKGVWAFFRCPKTFDGLPRSA